MARYRLLHHPAEDIRTRADEFSTLAEETWQQVESGIPPADACALFLQRAAQLLHGLSAVRSTKSLFATRGTPRTGASDDFRFLRIKGLPEAAARALVHWGRGCYDLQLLDQAPTPDNVLDLQCEGRRCVTLARHAGDWREGSRFERDPLTFFLHDLVHADYFLADPEVAHGQRQFFQELQRFREQGLAVHIPDTSDLQSRWHYLISDMNSHPEHLKATFRAWCYDLFKTDFEKSEDRFSQQILGQIWTRLFQEESVHY